jgi:diguanylate cyclase (GGDEF)-like protein
MLACIIVWRRQPGEPWVSERVSLERTAQLTALAFARLHHEHQLRYAAMHDGLTGVHNRVAFFAELEEVTSRAEPARRTAVLYLDLDGFKQVNDTYGHPIGDELLKIVTARIRDRVRPLDLVARLGGDEFAIVCTDLADVTEAEDIASRLVAAIAEPARIGDLEVQVGLSIGLAMAAANGETVARLVEAADRALYRAKQDGKGRYRVAT